MELSMMKERRKSLAPPTIRSNGKFTRFNVEARHGSR